MSLDDILDPYEVSLVFAPHSKENNEASSRFPNDRFSFREGENCWKVASAQSASLIIDAGNYYRAVHEAICNAKISIFIVGWDIDSRIKLLRGQDAGKSHAPDILFDLIEWKANQNPALQIYLNRWDYSFYMAAEREGLSRLRWSFMSPPNVHYCLDGVHPLGSCHHQKIIVIDDEIAFVGGMDIAIGRYDFRQHHPRNKARIDPGGTYEPRTKHSFGPHHDIQLALSGPIVKPLAELVRWRWHRATDMPALEMHPGEPQVKAKELSENSFGKPDFTDVTVALSRTMPPTSSTKAITEIEKFYLKAISEAKSFIYIENQYLTCQIIAEALNRELHRKPHLRVLIISCDKPQGIFESKAMWKGRVTFRDILLKGGVSNRALMAFPQSEENGQLASIRVHSKVMIVDDMLLHIGSANLNTRSMQLDSECDATIAVESKTDRQKILDIRNDLIREHTGLSINAICDLIDRNAGIKAFLERTPGSRQYLLEIDDEQYRHQSFTKIATWLADPALPLFWKKTHVPAPYAPSSRSFSSRLGLFFMGIALIGAVSAFAWKMTPLAHYVGPHHLALILEKFKNSPWALPLVIGMYIIGCALFFPLTILILTTALAFPALEAFILALSGALCSACCGYGIGRLASRKFLSQSKTGLPHKVTSYARSGGVLGVTLVRMVPLAPLGIVDLGLGIARISFMTYFIGTFLGLLPGIAVLSFLGTSLANLWKTRSWDAVVSVGCGLVFWVMIVLFSHYFIKRSQKFPHKNKSHA